MYNYDEMKMITEKIHCFGGSFMVAIWNAFMKADDSNKRKLMSLFKEDFDRYLKM